MRSPRALKPAGRRCELSVDPCSACGLFPAFVAGFIAHSRMDQLLEFFHRLRDVRALVAWGGYVGLTTIIFAETGLLIGFFLPGDSLLVTAGLLSSQPRFGLNLWLLGALLTVASIIGNTVGYY